MRIFRLVLFKNHKLPFGVGFRARWRKLKPAPDMTPPTKSQFLPDAILQLPDLELQRSHLQNDKMLEIIDKTNTHNEH